MIEYSIDLSAGVILIVFGTAFHNWYTWGIGVSAFMLTVICKNIAASRAKSE